LWYNGYDNASYRNQKEKAGKMVGNNYSPTGISIEQSIGDFLKLAGVNSRHTRHAYGTALRHFKAWLKDNEVPPTLSVDALTIRHAYDFASWLAGDYETEDEEPLNRRSRAVYLIALKRYYDYLVMNKRYIKVDTMDYVEFEKFIGSLTKLNQRTVDNRLPSDEIIEALLQAIEEKPTISEDATEGQRRRQKLVWLRNRAIVLSLYSSGMRVGELCSLKRGNLNRTTQTALVVGKGDKERAVRFSANAWEAIMAYLDERKDGAASGALEDKPLFCRHDPGAGDRRLALSAHSVRELFTRLAEETGIAELFNLTPHTLRHYFATRFLGFTGNLALTQDALGHADPRTTRIYAKTTDEQIKEAHKELFNDPPLIGMIILNSVGRQWRNGKKIF
jgi:site-specific recombinase XerD